MEENQSMGGYIRVESGSGDSNDFEKQKRSIDEFARSKGMDVIDYFVDETDVTVPLHKREGYSKLNDAIVSGKINTIVTTEMEKFTDDAREKQGLLHNFAEKGVEIYISSTGENINPSAPLTKEQRLLSEAMRDMEEIKAKTHRH